MARPPSFPARALAIRKIPPIFPSRLSAATSAMSAPCAVIPLPTIPAGALVQPGGFPLPNRRNTPHSGRNDQLRALPVRSVSHFLSHAHLNRPDCLPKPYHELIRSNFDGAVMCPFLRPCLSAGFFPAATGLLGLVLLSTASAQTTTNSSPSSPASASDSVPRQPVVITNENIGLPRITHPKHPPASSQPQPASLVQKTPQISAQDVADNTAEITALQKQIQNKRKRIELLMHLFVTDERQFVQSPTESQQDSEARARVHNEQEELRAETAACARLQARLDAVLASNISSH